MKDFPIRGNKANKDNVMARYCHSSTFLEGVSIEQYEELQSLSGFEFSFLKLLRKSIFCHGIP